MKINKNNKFVILKNRISAVVGTIAAVVSIFAACCVDSEGVVGDIAFIVTLIGAVIGYLMYLINDCEK